MKADDAQDASYSNVYAGISTLSVPNAPSKSQVDSPTISSLPQSRGRSRTFSQVPLPFKLNSAVEEGISFPENKQGSNKALEESRKLLSHILNELANRPRPPPIWADFKVSTFENKKGGSTKSSFSKHTSDRTIRPKEMVMRTLSLPLDSEEEEDASFSPDTAYDLLSRLREVLLIAHLRNWQLFDSR